MKKLLSVFGLIITFGISAQSLIVIDIEAGSVIASSSRVFLQSRPANFVRKDFDIKNVSQSTKVYAVKRYDVLLHSDNNQRVDAYFCYADKCNPVSSYLSAASLTLTAGQSASQLTSPASILSVYLNEYTQVTGLSVVKYTIFNTSDVTDSLQLTLRYNDNGTTGLAAGSLEFIQAKLMPNPASAEQVNLLFASTEACGGKLTLVNALGQVVYKKDVEVNAGENRMPVETNGLAQGMYYVNLHADNKRFTERLTIY